MSQHKHKEFITTADPPYHHEKNKISRPYPSYRKLVFRSVDRDAGSLRINARYSGVTLNEKLTTPAVLIVESFQMANADSGALNNTVLELRMAGLINGRSWDSKTKANSDLMCAFKGYSFQNGSVNVDTVGIPVYDPNAFQNALINIYFTTNDGTTINDFVGDWTLVLNIVALDDSVPDM
jgi:hypothetical protein